MTKIGIFYGSTLGDTKSGAELIKNEIKDAEVFDVANASMSEVEQFNKIIFGASTWGLGDLQDDWVNFIEEIKNINFKGKKVAIFGYGDQESYIDTFVDAMGSIYDVVVKNGGTIVGEVDVEGYSFSESTAVRNGKFVGLPLDENNQGNLTAERIKNWVQQLNSQF